MSTLEFLQHILPSSGYYVALAIVNGRAKQFFLDDIQSLADTCTRIDKAGADAYYGISSFKTKKNRKQENVQEVKVIPVDIDCGPGKPYATHKEGLAALFNFIKTYKLPKPTIVNSGGGLHAYWHLNQAVSLVEWREIAQSLKAATQHTNFHIDSGKTGDAACVLRPIGTHNRKLAPKLVSQLLEGTATPYVFFRSAFAGTGGVSHTVSSSNLLSAIKTQQTYPPAIAGLIADKCAQIRHVADTRGNVDEPLWYAALGIAGYCEDDEYVAINWSDGHSTFSERNTIDKMEQWRAAASGPPTCKYFENIQPERCKDCRFKGKINTPVTIGTRHKEVTVSDSAPDEEARIVALPRPFKRTASGIKVVLDDVEIDVCPFDIYPLGQGLDVHAGYEVARFRWDRPNTGWSLLELPVRDLAEAAQEFVKHLGDAGITPANKTQAIYMSLMLRQFMAELNKAKAPTNLYTSMGWKDKGDEFVLGGTIYKRDKDTGVVNKEPIGLSKNAPKHILNAYTTRGEAKDWVSFTGLLDEPSLVYYRFILGIAFGCPLWVFGGLGGVVVSLFGETGSGKTTIQNWMQSVYGNPLELLIPAVATQNATFSRLGVYNNLPATIDEMSVLPAKDTANFIYWASLGKDKPRLTAESIEREANRFSTMVVGSTNMALTAKLLVAKTQNSALLMRLLELTIPRHSYFEDNSDKGRDIYNFVHSNYGSVGPIYISHLVSLGHDKLRDMVDDSLATFNTRYGVRFSGEERFWEHAVVLADLGNKIASDIGIIKYSYRQGTEWVLEQINMLRGNVKEQEKDCFDILGMFLSAHVGSSVSVTYTGSQPPYFDINRLTKEEIHVRHERFRDKNNEKFKYGFTYIGAACFNKWAVENSRDPNSIRRELEKEGVLRTLDRNRYYMGKNVGIATGQIIVICINLARHHRLASILNDSDAPTGAGQLTLVENDAEKRQDDQSDT